ncbi:MAG: ABC transporter ATP-binding protein, partial [Clostridia bacterium]|nr:ABC transporter ATP-binding protein [Clostridia bacterium]
MSMVKTFLSYYKPHWKLFSIDMLCAFLVACCDLVYPLIAEDIISDYVPNRNLRMVIVWAVVMLLIYVAKCFLNFVVQYWGHIVGVRMQGDMRRDMFRHLQKLPFSFFDENKTGTLMSRMINDLQEVSELAHHGPENVFLAAVMLIGSFVLLGRIDIWLAVIAFSLVPLMLLFSWRARKMMRDAFSKARVETGEVNANVETAIAGMRVSRAYTAADHEVSKFLTANARLIKAREKSYYAMGYFNSGTGLFTDLMYLVGLVAGGLFFYFGRINGGEFTAYLLFINNFLKPINRIISFFEQFINGMTGFKRFQDIMSQQPESDEPGAVKPERLAGNIRFENISFRYRNSDAADSEARVIDNLNLQVKQGETLALVGPSGGGKTTLCHLIPRFYEPDAGVISIDGMDVRSIDRMALRRNIGMVAQEVFLFNGTIKENIAYGDLDASDEAIMEAAKKASIHDYIMTLENGYDTQVGERGVKLSGGQK